MNSQRFQWLRIYAAFPADISGACPELGLQYAIGSGSKGGYMLAQQIWSLEQWKDRSALLAHRVQLASDEHQAMRIIADSARQVLRSYSTSFYMVTRFLPPQKRRQVEIIYAAVRFPDELVDTFSVQGADVIRELASWRNDYEAALACPDLRQALQDGCNPYISAFARLVRERGIPPEHYRSFLAAMESDLEPRSFSSLEDLVDNYIYGSATVVGYFLTYVYDASSPQDFPEALLCARDLAIALQLTNFARDVADDRNRGRLYIPLDLLPESGWSDGPIPLEITDADLLQARRRIAEYAQQKYREAHSRLASFHPDSRVAIDCCIKVYSLLNNTILENDSQLDTRFSVSGMRKFSVLPSSKYWRVPLSIVGLI